MDAPSKKNRRQHLFPVSIVIGTEVKTRSEFYLFLFEGSREVRKTLTIEPSQEIVCHTIKNMSFVHFGISSFADDFIQCTSSLLGEL